MTKTSGTTRISRASRPSRVSRVSRRPPPYDPLGADAPPAPAPVHAAFVLWLVAVAAGAFETVVAVVDRATGADGSLGSLGSLAGGVALRMAVFSAAVLLAVQLRRGRNWARCALTVGLGVFGALSLVIGPVQWLADGHGVGDAVTDLSVADVLFGASRVLHLAAVLTAVVLMFRPAANAYFKRATTGRRPGSLTAPPPAR
ncbi:hypothetical protein [Streptomyces sp. NPDC059009]|uniref:hypothetical protein n=1 Tax=Streptomyces sp. NPDC059009 TaxID=3346694 RepID=UPI0036889F75